MDRLRADGVVDAFSRRLDCRRFLPLIQCAIGCASECAGAHAAGLFIDALSADDVAFAQQVAPMSVGEPRGRPTSSNRAVTSAVSQPAIPEFGHFVKMPNCSDTLQRAFPFRCIRDTTKFRYYNKIILKSTRSWPLRLALSFRWKQAPINNTCISASD